MKFHISADFTPYDIHGHHPLHQILDRTFDTFKKNWNKQTKKDAKEQQI